MDTSAVDDFVRTRRARLGEEKTRLGLKWNPRRLCKLDCNVIHGVDWCMVNFRPSAVLPDREWQTERRGEQRQVTVDLRSKQTKKSSPPSQDILDVRRRMAEDRYEELGHHRAVQQEHRRPVMRNFLWSQRNFENHQDDHTGYAQRAPKNYGHDLSDEGRSGSSWADDERKLDSWMREKGRVRNLARQRSALYSSSKDEDDSGSRSLSAPVVGIAAIGQQEDPELQRRKQMEYAAALKEQIREKKEVQRLHWGEFDKSRSRRELDHHSKRGTERQREQTERQSGYHHQDPSSYFDDRDLYQHPTTRARDRGLNYPPNQPGFRLPPQRGYYAGAFDPYFYLQYPPYPHYRPPPLPYHTPPEHYEHYMENPFLPVRSERANNRSPSPPEVHKQEVKWSDRREETDRRDDTMPFSGLNSAVRKRGRAAYQQELQRQIQEKKEQQERDKREKERYFNKLEEEAKNYNPWGKPGAGAPLRDEKGNIVAARGLRTSVDGTSPRFIQLTEEELKKLSQEKHAQDLAQQVTSVYCHTYSTYIHTVAGSHNSIAIITSTIYTKHMHSDVIILNVCVHTLVECIKFTHNHAPLLCRSKRENSKGSWNG